MEGGSQAQDHGKAIYTKIRYSVSSTFATGCSIEQTWNGLAILVQMMLIAQNNDRKKVGKPRSLWGLIKIDCDGLAVLVEMEKVAENFTSSAKKEIALDLA